MNKKTIGISLMIIIILAISFFWGGTQEVVPLEADTTYEDINKVENIDKIEDIEIIEDDGEKENSQEDKSNEIIAKEEVDEPKEVEKPEAPKPLEESPKDNQEGKQDVIVKDKEKDKYLTDPVPEGKPAPVEWQDVKIDKNKERTVTLSVTAKTILNNMNLFNKDKLEVLPEDGIIFPSQSVVFYEGESVFDVLLREMKKNKIHMEFVMTPIYNSHYIEGINNIYEFDCGELSGWMYRVNDWFPNYGVSRYQLEEGDNIELIYTCDLGRDIGGGFAIGGDE